MFPSLDWLLGVRDSGFMPHGHCYLWRLDLLVGNVLSDTMIFAAYAAISVALWRFARARRDLRHDRGVYRLCIASGVFILACGLTHLMEVWTVWNPDYWITTAVKLVTAIASVGTALMLWPFVPQAIALPSAADMAELSTHLQVVREDEKQVIAKRLHDELGTGLTVVSMDLYNIHRRLEEERHPLATNMGMAIRLLNSMIDVKRSVIEELRPTILHELGLRDALQQLARRFTDRTGIACRLESRGDTAVDEELGITLFRVAQESLEEAAEHPGIQSVVVVLERTGGTVQLSVRHARADRSLFTDSPQGYRWRNCRQLLARWRGTFDVEARPGDETVITATAQVG